MLSHEHVPSRKRKAAVGTVGGASVGRASFTDPTAPPCPKIARLSTAKGLKLSKFSKGEIVYYCKNGLRTRSTVLTVYTHDPSGAFYDIRLEGEGDGGRVKQTIEEYLCKLSESQEQGHAAVTTVRDPSVEDVVNDTQVPDGQLQRCDVDGKGKHKTKKKEKKKEKKKTKKKQKKMKKEGEKKSKKQKKKKKKKTENKHAGGRQGESSSSDDRQSAHFDNDQSTRKKAKRTKGSVSGSLDVDLEEQDDRQRRTTVKVKKDRKKKKKKSRKPSQL
eukprot:INCI6218.2.p1 GENE.INCI6218.2~~INCI6218.2.p1  ORF type:complete len:274 (-),score=61.20 INCI6218.2:1259-2080(-)